MKPWSLGKDDWSLTNAVLAIVAIVSVVPFVTGLADWLRGRPLELLTGAVVASPPVEDAQLAPGVTGVYTGEALFTITDPSLSQWLASLLVPLMALVVGLVCVWMVARLVRHARHGDPFHPEAHLAVRVLGLVLFCYGLFTPLVGWLMTAMITTDMRGGEFATIVSLRAADWWPALVGLVVGVVGESVFGRGRELADDAEGLI